MKKNARFSKKNRKPKLTLVVSRGKTIHRIDDDILYNYKIKRMASLSKNN